MISITKQKQAINILKMGDRDKTDSKQEFIN